MHSRAARPLVLSLALVVAATGCAAKPPVEDADPQGVLTTIVGVEPHLDPALVGGGLHVLSVFEPLLRFDPKTLRPMAGSAQLPTVSEDGLTYRLTVRDDSKFSDGTSVRARDFAFGFSRICDPAIKGPYASVGYDVVGCAEWSQLDPKKASPEALRAAREKLTTIGIRATGDKDLTITLTHAASYFSSILALWVFAPVRQADVEHGGDLWTQPATYIGNGPFVLSAWKHNDRLVFTPNPYFRAPSKLKQWIKVILTESAVQLEAYRHGEIDVLDLSGTAGSIAAEVQNDPALQKETVRTTTACTNWAALNERRPPFDDPSVRLAFAKAIDRDAYVRDVLGGLGVPALSLIARGLPGYDAADEMQRFDPAEARRLVAASRYAGTEALRSVVIPHNLQPFPRLRAQWLRDQWRTNLGMDVASEQVEGPVLTARFARLETVPHVFFAGWCADYPDQQNWLTLLFHSKSAFTSTTVWGGYGDPAFDRLVSDADREPERTKRDDLYLKASRLLSASAPVAFLGTNTRLVLLKPWVRGVVDSPLDYEIGLFAGQESIYIAKRRN
jgi:oligopeptide transport system substrate-binding protein